MLIYLEKETMTYDLTSWNSNHITFLVYLSTFKYDDRHYAIVHSQYLSPLNAVFSIYARDDKCSIQVSMTSLSVFWRLVEQELVTLLEHPDFTKVFSGVDVA